MHELARRLSILGLVAGVGFGCGRAPTEDAAGGLEDVAQPVATPPGSPSGPSSAFGKTAVGGFAAGMTADKKRGSRYALGAAGNIVALRAYVDGNGAGSGTEMIRGVIYASDGAGGSPKTLACQTVSASIAKGQAAGWVDLAMAGTCALTAGDYYLGLHTGGATQVARLFRDQVAGALSLDPDGANPFASGPSNPWGTVLASTGQVSIYGVVASTFGATAVGGVVGGMTANKKRATAYALPTSGAVSLLRAYLDGNGTGTGGSEAVQGVVYDDSGAGRDPGALRCSTSVIAVPAGQAAGWVDLPVTGTCSLSAGTYYLGLLTGASSQVARAYGSAVAGALKLTPDGEDLFSSGPSATWGTVLSLDDALTIQAAYVPSTGGGGGGGGGFNPPFPRIASYRIGGSQIYDAAFQAWAAKQALAIIGGNWEGWANSGRNRDAVVRSIKSQSTLGTKVLQYGIPDGVDTQNDGHPKFTAQINANNWYLWLQGTGGTHAVDSSSPNYWQTNATDFVSSDANGRKLEDAFAVYQDAEYRTGGTANAAPSLDGHYHDNVFFYSRQDGDFDRNGTTDSGKAFGLAWRTGERRYFDQLKAIDPNLIRFGNMDDMYSLGVTDPTDTAAAAPLDGIMHGALLEGFMGKPYSLETFVSWSSTMNEYRFRMNMTIAPHLVVCGHGAMASNGSDPYDSAPYRAMRYGIGSTLLDDGYYAYSPDGYPDNVLFSFDELGGNPGGPDVGYLGFPTELPPTAAWQNGVWRRDFDHGIVLVNPKGNGAQTVSLGGTFKHLVGSQNPSLNNGSAVTTVTLQSRDGLILVR